MHECIHRLRLHLTAGREGEEKETETNFPASPQSCQVRRRREREAGAINFLLFWRQNAILAVFSLLLTAATSLLASSRFLPLPPPPNFSSPVPSFPSFSLCVLPAIKMLRVPYGGEERQRFRSFISPKNRRDILFPPSFFRDICIYFPPLCRPPPPPRPPPQPAPRPPRRPHAPPPPPSADLLRRRLLKVRHPHPAVQAKDLVAGGHRRLQDAAALKQRGRSGRGRGAAGAAAPAAPTFNGGGCRGCRRSAPPRRRPPQPLGAAPASPAPGVRRSPLRGGGRAQGHGEHVRQRRGIAGGGRGRPQD